MIVFFDDVSKIRIQPYAVQTEHRSDRLQDVHERPTTQLTQPINTLHIHHTDYIHIDKNNNYNTSDTVFCTINFITNIEKRIKKWKIRPMKH